MKRSIVAACLIVSTSIILTACSSVRQASSGFLIAGGENVDYTFEYPETWEKTRDDGMDSGQIAGFRRKRFGDGVPSLGGLFLNRRVL